MEIETVIHRTFLWAITLVLFILPLGGVYALVYFKLFAISRVGVIAVISLTLLFFLNYYKFFKPRIDHVFRRRKEDYYKVLSEIPSRIGSSLDLKVFCGQFFKEVKNILYVRNGLMVIRPPEKKEFKEEYETGYEELKKHGLAKPEQVVLAQDDLIIQHLAQNMKVLERDEVVLNPGLESIRERALEFFNATHLELLIPLTMGNELIGLLGLGKKENLSPYTIRDVDILANIGKQVGITVDNALHHKDIVEKERIEEELRLGKQIQSSLLPQVSPRLPHLVVEGLSQPAKEIGGDYFDFISLDDNTKLGVVIGDVSGKGVAAGLLMAMVKTAIHILSPEDQPRDILLKINSILDEHIGGEKFMTMLYLIWQSQNSSITYSSAGHEHILVFRDQTKEIEIIQSGGIILGIMPDIREFLEENSIRLAKGDKMLLYTDGVTEAHDVSKNRFGLDRLSETFRKYSPKPALEIMQAVKDEVYSFIGSVPQYDDITIIVLEAV
ncbi:MAG: SpoIIE family protein phosphatase, partial [bacterium]|nr:SpoIIE family protein phosphatase [bacterium]